VPALIFDCDGVLADTERDGHRVAFNRMFSDVGVSVRWSPEEYGVKLKIGGGKERMTSLLTPEFVAAEGLPSDPGEQREMIADWHRRKTAYYTELVASGALPGRPGIRRITAAALAAGWQVAVASTSAEAAVRAVLEHVVGAEAATRFTVLAGDVVARKKPAPDIYELAVERLGADRDEAIVVEDSRNGLLAADGAGLRCVVTVNGYTAQEDQHEAVLVVSSLGDPGGEETRVLANRGPATPGAFVTLDDLAACLAAPRPEEKRG
jgi:HAD superfamily hydrolase (TIGR01509 family)